MGLRVRRASAPQPRRPAVDFRRLATLAAGLAGLACLGAPALVLGAWRPPPPRGQRAQLGVSSSLGSVMLTEPGSARDTLANATAVAKAIVAGATGADGEASSAAYTMWAEQFPIAAARREYYGLPSGRVHVRARFLALAHMVGVSAQEALEIFKRDLWVLTEPSERIFEKLGALREVAGSEEEVLDFLRAAPRAIATTSVEEVRQRGVANMLARSALGEAYEVLISPLRFVVQQSARATAREIECKSGVDDECEVEVLADAARGTADRYTLLTNIFFGSLAAGLVWVAYVDTYYGGPIHGKGFCIPGAFPAYNLPDAEGNARLPCNCAPLWKWYIEPRLSSEERTAMLESAPKVESKNCGRTIGGERKECDPTTNGGCVWTAEDLAKDPATWDRRELTYWERQRDALKS